VPAKRKAEDVTATAEDEEVDYDECERLMKDVNAFSDRAAVTIPDEVANRVLPGIDFMNLHFGRKLFGQILS
jgi:hypothetical protein